MNVRRTDEAASVEITRALAEFAHRLTFADLDDDMVVVARHCILDWLGVTIAAVDEDVVTAARAQVIEDGGDGQATVLATNYMVAAAQAALVNGVAGHALDYDDVLRPLRGHPTAPVLPAVLALAEKTGASGQDLLSAFTGGIEVAARVGALLGDSHYESGWHSTATVGTFGAAAGCAALLGLDKARCGHALGLAGIQAAGLKAGFGTMAKPYQVGKAAANGLVAAQMAARDVTSRPDILECAQGVGATQTSVFDAAAIDGLGILWLARDVLFKHHAACYGTHAPIEAAIRIRSSDAFASDSIDRVVVNVGTRCLGNCNIIGPRTGLQGKFSLRFTTALALLGEDTAAIGTYCEEMVTRPDIVDLMGRTEVHGHESLDRNVAELSAQLADGIVVTETFDVGKPDPDLDYQERKLGAKFRSLSEPVIGTEKTSALLDAVANLETLSDIRDLTALARA